MRFVTNAQPQAHDNLLLVNTAAILDGYILCKLEMRSEFLENVGSQNAINLWNRH